MPIRRIAKLFKSRPTIEGAGVHLKRAFGYSQVPQFDPFLMLDDFHTSNPAEYLPGFPWHPHRGIETITYVLAGTVEHGDSLGNRGTLGAGDVQWMTAGSGILHQEMPSGNIKGQMHGLQLWGNLPAAQKIARALAEFDTFWHGDPIRMDGLESLKAYARTSPAPVCASLDSCSIISFWRSASSLLSLARFLS